MSDDTGAGARSETAPRRIEGQSEEPLSSPEEVERETRADLPLTSTDHSIASPGSRPNTVATDCGTVVFNEAEPATARNTLDSNRRATPITLLGTKMGGRIYGLSRGRCTDLIFKYHRQYRSTHRSMSGTRGPWGSEVEERAIRLLSTHREAVRPNGRVRFEVKSTDGTRKYEVAVDPDGWSCDCEAWEDRKTPCKHIIAAVRWLDPNPPPILDEDLAHPKRPTYKQADPGLYDEAQQLEHQLFDAMLWDLLGTVNERVCETGHRGRPSIPLRTQILVAVRKVHLAQSSRRARGLLIALNRDGKGILPRIPNYTAPSRLLNRPYATGILLGLVEQSGLVLKDIEDQGTVAIDSSGFCTTCMGAYCTEVHEPNRRHKWLKAHLAIGVKTHIVLSATVTDEHGADYTQFIPLLRKLSEVGHRPAFVVADKAYLGRGNIDEAATLDIEPFIPFKTNSRGLSKGAPMWTRKYHEFMARRDDFDAIYHRRSNVESAFSAIKRKLGEPLLSHNQGARINELLAKVLAYNIGIVIQQSVTHGLPPGPVGMAVGTEAPTAPGPEGASA
jgi:transposase